MQLHELYYILIDDDAINNKLTGKILERLYVLKEQIYDFIDPAEALDFVLTDKLPAEIPVIFFIDVTMPEMDCWEFVEKLTKARPKMVGKNYLLHIISSSVNKDDMTRAQSTKGVEYYLIKPLTRESIRLVHHVIARRKGWIQ